MSVSQLKSSKEPNSNSRESLLKLAPTKLEALNMIMTDGKPFKVGFSNAAPIITSSELSATVLDGWSLNGSKIQEKNEGKNEKNEGKFEKEVHVTGDMTNGVQKRKIDSASTPESSPLKNSDRENEPPKPAKAMKKSKDLEEIKKSDKKKAASPIKTNSSSISSFFPKQNICPHCKNDSHVVDAYVAELEIVKSSLQNSNNLSTKLTAEIQTLKDLCSKQKSLLDAEGNKQKSIEILVRENAIHSSKLRAEKVLRDDVAIGRIAYMREGMHVNELWEDGFRFQELKSRKDRINKEKENIEEERKALAARRKTSKKKSLASSSVADEILDQDGFKKPDPLTADESILELDEIFKIRLLQLKKEEKECLEIENQLEIDRKLHIRFSKLLFDEKTSLFRDHIKLNDRYVIVKLLGKGGFGEVHQAYDLVTCKYVACKIHQLNPHWSDSKKESYVRHATREYNIHKRLDHPHVVPMLDVFEININSFCTVMDYCDGEDLDFLLKLNGTYGEREAKSIIMQVFSALKYFNEQKLAIIHYDLKPGNILFHKNQVKLTDFGLSKQMEAQANSTELTSQGAGTLWYLPPEVHAVPAPRVSSKVDVWSVGIIYYQLLFGKRPFGDGLSQETFASQIHMISSSRVEFPAKPVISDESKKFINYCLTVNHLERPSVLEMYSKTNFLTYSTIGSN